MKHLNQIFEKTKDHIRKTENPILMICNVHTFHKHDQNHVETPTKDVIGKMTYINRTKNQIFEPGKKTDLCNLRLSFKALKWGVNQFPR